MKGAIKMAEDKLVSKLIGAAFAGAAGIAGYTFLMRPRHLKWGATDAEAREPLPGDDLLPNPEQEATHAITINAPVSDVWPWLVQIGQNKGGFYSYSWLENLAGCNIHNANRIVPEWQSLRVGDVVWLHPKAPPLPVIVVEPNREIVFGAIEEIAEGNGSTSLVGGTWGLYLKEVNLTTTRLLVRARWTRDRGVKSWFSNYAVLEPAHFIMERKMMLNIKQRVENLTRQRVLEGQVDGEKRVAEVSH
jgi:hypothetical protein